MSPDDFHDLGLCPDCGRDMTAGELHTADCRSAIEQDHADGDHSGCDHERTITLTLTDLQMEALDAWSNVTDPDPCYEHEDGEHGDFSDCMGYAPEFEAALWEAYERIYQAWRAAE